MTLITRLTISDVLMIEPKRFGDDRGYFTESYNASALAAFNFTAQFVQDNQSMSVRKGTVRGLHFQAPPKAQDKLVRVLKGAIFDAAVDIRKGSPTYGRSVGVKLSADNGRQLLIPKGFAHGFQTLADETEVFYKVTDGYAPEAEQGLLWSDPALSIQWPIDRASATVNARDAEWPVLAEMNSPFSL